MFDVSQVEIRMVLRISLLLLCLQYSLAEPLPIDGDMQLKLVQIVWRHGARNPTESYPGDQYSKEFWDGRGGMGELTARGMEMHVSLGDKLRQRYIENGTFLLPGYNAAEIYVRSTDVNRTIISAISNMIGMYGQGHGSNPGLQYPNKFDNPRLQWPGAFVPVAVHTVDDDTDHLGNANAYCPRQDAIWAYAEQNAPEIALLKNDKDTIEVQQILNASTGHLYSLDDFWIPHDVLFIEKDNDLQLPTWATKDFIDKLTKANNQVEDYQDGIGLKTLNGVDFSVELPKLRAGALTNDMAMHMNLKLDCEGVQNQRNCSWINKLKYYAYSAHDETVSSFLATLGAKSAVVEAGYPKYSAAAIVELWTDTKTKKNYFKLIYHKGYGDAFDVVTKHVVGCENRAIYCDLDIFRQRANLYNPGDADQYCQNVDLGFSTTAAPTNPPVTQSTGYYGLFTTFLLSALIVAFR